MIEFQGLKLMLDTSEQRFLQADVVIYRGDRVFIFGPNGCGKSSLLDLIAGTKKPHRGHVNGISDHELVGYAVQNPGSSLLPWLSVKANILLPSRLSGCNNSVENKATSLMDRFGLLCRMNDYPYKLSGGEKQIVNFVRTMCTPCQILLFDEVTASLHVRFRTILYECIREAANESTILFVSHSQDDLIMPFNRYFSIANDILFESSHSNAYDILHSRT